MLSFVFVVLAILSAFAIAAPPAGYVPTPGGFVHVSCLHHAGNASTVKQLADGSHELTFANGIKAIHSKCKYPRIPAHKGKQQQQQRATTPAPPNNGWQVFSYFNAGKTVNKYTGNWNVPQSPSYNGQLLYTFTAFQDCFGANCPYKSVDIIQPVLQFGVSPAGGGDYWGIASWYVSSDGAAYFSTFQKVADSSSVYGEMLKTGDNSPTNNKWAITTKGSGSPTVLNVHYQDTFIEPWTFVTLEVYGVKSCSAYPSDPLKYTSLAISDGSPITPQWILSNANNACNEKVSSSGPSAVTITW